MNEEFADNLEENIEEVPQEVRDFIFGADFKVIKNQLIQNIDNELERLEFSNMLMFFLLGSKTAEEFNLYIQSLTISADKKELIKKSIRENIVDEILLLIEVHQEMDQEGNTDSTSITQPVIKPTPAVTSLTALADRLKQSSSSVPSTRNYGPQKGIVPDNLPTTEPSAAPATPVVEIPATQAQPDELAAPVMPAIETSPAPTPTVSTSTPTGDPYHEPIE